MKRGQPFVEGDDTPVVVSCEGHEVGVGDLAVAENTGKMLALIRDRIWPEAVPRLGPHGVENSDRIAGDLSFPEEKAQECSFGDGTCGHVGLGLFKPCARRLVVEVLDHRQCHVTNPVLS